jgi:hypothetical protein
MTAVQGATKHKSLLALDANAILNDYEELQEWINTCLGELLGVLPVPVRQVPHHILAMAAPLFGSDLGKALARGLNKAAPRLSKYKDNSTKDVAKYSPYKWNHSMAFSGETWADDVPQI